MSLPDPFFQSNRVPQLSHLYLIRTGSGRPGSPRAAAVMLEPQEFAVGLRQVCWSVRQMTEEMLGLSGDRIRFRRDRRRALCHIRQVAMYVCHVALRIPQADVAHAFGRDRTTVRHACARVEDRRDDPVYDDFVAAVERVAIAVFEPAEGDFDAAA